MQNPNFKIQKHFSRIIAHRIELLIVVLFATILVVAPVVAVQKRIISTMPSNTEILYALGLGDRIIAVTDSCNYPKDALKKEKIGGVKLNIEKIVSLRPDLIVMFGDAQKQDIERLKALKMPVFVINPTSLKALEKDIRRLGKATGTQVAANRIANNLKWDIEEINKSKKSTKSKKVYVDIWHDPLITAGKDTFINDFIVLAGGINVGAKATGSYPSFSVEQLVRENPDFIIVSGNKHEDIERVKNDRRLKNIYAVKRGNIILIDSDIITRPTLRFISTIKLINKFININEK